jgi:hypothetical protein
VEAEGGKEARSKPPSQSLNQEMGIRRWESGDGNQEMGIRRWESGDGFRLPQKLDPPRVQLVPNNVSRVAAVNQR